MFLQKITSVNQLSLTIKKQVAEWVAEQIKSYNVSNYIYS